MNPLTSLFAQQDSKQNAILITNANVFDGQNENLATGMSVLVEGNKITKIAKKNERWR